MRRLTQHAIAAVVVTGLGAGVVASTWGSSTAEDRNSTVAVPAVATAPPTPSAEKTPDRATRDSRDDDRSELTGQQSDESAAAAEKRAHALAEQRGAISDQEKSIKKKKAEAAAKKREKAAAAKRAAEKKAEAERKKAAAEGYSSDTSEPREIARQLIKNKYSSWGEGEFKCYDLLIKSESQWDIDATNPSSGAYGIPQSLPGNKMATEGSDWKTNPATQIKWGLKYVKDRYGTPCSAWSFKQGHQWY